MWITLITKLPTRPSPPKLSIFWSEPWINGKAVKDQKKRQMEEHQFFTPFGREPDWSGARKIQYCGCDIRVFPHEFNPVKIENMKLYVYGIDGDEKTKSHELVMDTAAERQLISMVLEGDLKVLRDAALLDGCSEAQAIQTALGIDITDQLEFPPIGWYRCLPHYAKIYCSEFEMMEHREATIEPTKDLKETRQEEYFADFLAENF